MKICVNLGSRTANLVKFVIFVEKGELKELEHAEMGVLRNC